MKLSVTRQSIARCLKIILGNFLITGAYAFITVPNEIVNGGVTSFSMILGSISSESTAVGFDVIALILNKKNPKINIALTMYLINTCVLLFGLLSYGITSVLTGIGFTALQSLTLNCLLKRKE
ncbi:YitT family protein [Sellimonas catena]|uniref:Uncharacterized protein n=1 Tax=Sellimonas catena TaxID=2994035 RepID=A0A9W6CFS5_9FIRM|nr:YitT family protein [Sellimonas catena]GLG91271.1 hypothetical protein Selli2_26980 [Sellimonas catena]